jgi:hypothetical protein
MHRVWYKETSQSRVRTDGQSVCLDVEPLLVLMTICLLLSDDYCRVFVGILSDERLGLSFAR